MALLNFHKPEKIIIHKVTDFEGKFEFKPLEPGFGATIGNSLRRVLLNSLEGYAITGIQIEGVEHEFATIAGVIEDVTEIILNLKQIRFKLKEGLQDNVKSERIEFTIKGVSQFKAKDIEDANNTFNVVNKDFIICNMNSSVELKIRLHIAKGRGYASVEENRPKESKLGFIAIDSIHTPIKNVKYSVENTRVEQHTDYEKLLLEIITDGTVNIEQSLKDASAILVQHLLVIADKNITDTIEKEEIEVIVDDATMKIRQILKTPLEDLDLSVRAFNCLKAAKITSLSELVKYEKEDLMKFRNFGEKSLDEIQIVLKHRGLFLGMDLGKIYNN
ncbi:MAG: DNA-directed RNA polymerase subunit alpha [Chitinophagaceae bacterium]